MKKRLKESPDDVTTESEISVLIDRREQAYKEYILGSTQQH